MKHLFDFILSGAFIFLLSYLCGSIPFGYLIGKFNGVDIRKHGSRNIGATNVRRVLGRDWSIICFIFDFLKGLLPVMYIGHRLAAYFVVDTAWGGIIAAIAAVLGHIFPFWLRFKGGKGVATSLGVITGIAFLPVIVGGLFWLFVFYWKRIVSLASMTAVIVIFIASIILKLTGHSAVSWPGIGLLGVIGALVIIRHKDNISRLREGTESVFVKSRNH